MLAKEEEKLVQTHQTSYFKQNVRFCIWLHHFCRSSFSDLCQSKHSKDERFRAVEKMRDKEELFKDFIAEVRRREKEESRSLKEKVRRAVYSKWGDIVHSYKAHSDLVLGKSYNEGKFNHKDSM